MVLLDVLRGVTAWAGWRGFVVAFDFCVGRAEIVVEGQLDSRHFSK